MCDIKHMINRQLIPLEQEDRDLLNGSNRRIVRAVRDSAERNWATMLIQCGQQCGESRSIQERTLEKLENRDCRDDDCYR